MGQKSALTGPTGESLWYQKYILNFENNNPYKSDFFLDFQVSDRIDAITDDMADLETNDDTTANDAFDAIAKQSEAAESKAIETGILLLFMVDQEEAIIFVK